MNKERIIANIEHYIGILSNEEKAEYIKAFNYTIDENKKAKEIYPIVALAEIVQTLELELKEQAQKETKGNTFVKRSKLITKLLDKSFSEKYKKGFYEEINGEKMVCCLIDGYYAFMLYDIDIPMLAEGEKAQFTLSNILPDYKSFTVCDFDIADIKAALKLHKAKKDKTKCVTEINGKYYDTGYFINVIDGLGGDIKMYQNSNPIAADVFESENGLALLCPCRKP